MSEWMIWLCAIFDMSSDAVPIMLKDRRQRTVAVIEEVS
jgi:hypothetical protein